MTQEELTKHIKKYFEERARGTRTIEVEVATSQAMARIEALVCWVRERDLSFWKE